MGGDEAWLSNARSIGRGRVTSGVAEACARVNAYDSAPHRVPSLSHVGRGQGGSQSAAPHRLSLLSRVSNSLVSPPTDADDGVLKSEQERQRPVCTHKQLGLLPPLRLHHQHLPHRALRCNPSHVPAAWPRRVVLLRLLLPALVPRRAGSWISTLR